MDRPPRNRELERLIIDVLRATEVGSGERHEAWQVYADWLLELGEPVGEWLAASLRADDGGDAAAPVRARLHEIERACSFRLVDLGLADLSEVPELARIADLTWERGFITSASIRAREFRAWDSELLEHTPDRLVDVVLRSPSACVLHDLHIDAFEFRELGSGAASVAGLIAALDEPLALRSLALEDGRAPLSLSDAMLAQLPALTRLSLWSHEVGRDRDSLHDQLALLWGSGGGPGGRSGGRSGRLPDLRALELRLLGGGDQAAVSLAESALVERLRSLRIDHVSDVGAEVILAHRDRFSGLEQFKLGHSEFSQPWSRALRGLGCQFVHL